MLEKFRVKGCWHGGYYILINVKDTAKNRIHQAGENYVDKIIAVINSFILSKGKI